MKFGSALGHLKSAVRPFASAVEQRRLLRQWRHHASPEQMDWDWNATKYNRIALVNLICASKTDPAYLEIGCFNDALFSSVIARKKVGVDPQRGGTVRATSDDFFEQNQEKFDIVFIDGLHTFEQVRRDVANALRCLNPDGWIALHDMLPRNWLEEHVPAIWPTWNGDVWKVAFEIAQSDGLDFALLLIDHGVGVIKPKSAGAGLADRYDELREQRFSYLCDNLQRLPLLEWDEGRRWLETRLP